MGLFDRKTTSASGPSAPGPRDNQNGGNSLRRLLDASSPNRESTQMEVHYASVHYTVTESATEDLTSEKDFPQSDRRRSPHHSSTTGSTGEGAREMLHSPTDPPASQRETKASTEEVVGGEQNSAPSQRSTTAAEPLREDSAELNAFEGSFDQPFWQKVAHKEQIEGLPHKSALQETRVDRLVDQHGSVEKALLWVLHECPMQGETIRMLSGMLPRGVDLKSRDVLDQTGETALHVAAERNFYHVAHGLLIYDKDAPIDKRGVSGKLPVEVAMDGGHDKIAALLVKNMSNASVRALFECGSDGKPGHSFQQLLKSKDMTETCQAVMDSCIEPTGEPDELRFHFNILETDRQCRPPTDDGFEWASPTAYHKATESSDKAVRQHALIRMLTYHKWSAYAEKLALMKLVFHLFFLFLMSFALISAIQQPDPTVYRSSKDHARAVFEVVSVLIVLYQIVNEARQMIRLRHEYFLFAWNYVRLLSSILYLVIIPLRFTKTCAQWHVASLAFALFWIRVLELLSITRFVGIYMQMLARILVKDVSRFLVVFVCVLITYAGSLTLALRGERWTGGGEESVNSSDPQLITELGITRIANSFGATLLTGFRSMVQQENLIDYINEEGTTNSYSWLGIIINIIFLFFLLVVLLNILIAQLSDTYAEVQGDAQHELEQNWADAIKQLEQEGGGLIARLRFKNYLPSKTILEPGDLLIGFELEVPAEGGDDKQDQERRELKMAKQVERQSELIESLSFQLKMAVDILRRMDEETNPRLMMSITHLQEDVLPSTVNQAMKTNAETVTGHVQQLQEKTSSHISNLGAEISPERVEQIVRAQLQQFLRPVYAVVDQQQRLLDTVPNRQELADIVRELLADRPPPPPPATPQRTLLTTLLGSSGSGASRHEADNRTRSLPPATSVFPRSARRPPGQDSSATASTTASTAQTPQDPREPATSSPGSEAWELVLGAEAATDQPTSASLPPQSQPDPALAHDSTTDGRQPMARPREQSDRSTSLLDRLYAAVDIGSAHPEPPKAAAGPGIHGDGTPDGSQSADQGASMTSSVTASLQRLTMATVVGGRRASTGSSGEEYDDDRSGGLVGGSGVGAAGAPTAATSPIVGVAGIGSLLRRAQPPRTEPNTSTGSSTSGPGGRDSSRTATSSTSSSASSGSNASGGGPAKRTFLQRVAEPFRSFTTTTSAATTTTQRQQQSGKPGIEVKDEKVDHAAATVPTTDEQNESLQTGGSTGREDGRQLGQPAADEAEVSPSDSITAAAAVTEQDLSTGPVSPAVAAAATRAASAEASVPSTSPAARAPAGLAKPGTPSTHSTQSGVAEATLQAESHDSVAEDESVHALGVTPDRSRTPPPPAQ